MAMFIDVTPMPGIGRYQLNKAVIIEGVKVPALFTWDGESVPGFLWPIIGSPFELRFMVPSMVHDYLYGMGDASGFTRKQADRLFKKLLMANGVDEERADTMYSGVRVGGRGHYNLGNIPA